MKIALGSDHAGFGLKERIKACLTEQGHEVLDVGTFSRDPVDYPEFAFKVAKKIIEGAAERGILVCGSGIGMCMAANRIKGIRAVNAIEPFTAAMSRRHNNSNVLCLGERFTGEDMALEIVRVWMQESFEGHRHERRIRLLDDYNL
ncbi:ribose 5-phosphate isomerase B [Thermodesulforhabdus norvegica]|uniref:Ribose-5-phosphate isomerase n=1 Tax=Thermodesulforhabdus norvegica TaxID=39841 RepID=A0A1I4SXL5_9BACT|nr:ribose 5-phosphate isomerase B [Thermodesulforhabdus norvegica]SFM69216.1 ribose-5-phosphate isomerase [Thermodesulforhabdus norvegica]